MSIPTIHMPRKANTDIHSHKLCAPDEESLNKMIKELDEKGYLIKEQ
jgi:transcriptional regulator of NAD metabolism